MTAMWKWKDCYPNYNLQNGTSIIDFKPLMDNKTKVALCFSANGKVVKPCIYTELDLSLSTVALSRVFNERQPFSTLCPGVRKFF